MNIIEYLRCFVGSMEREAGVHLIPQAQQEPDQLSPAAQAIKDIGAPYEGYVFVLNTQTTDDATQALRLGTYAVYGLNRDERMRQYRRGKLTREALDTLNTAGIFYSPEAC